VILRMVVTEPYTFLITAVSVAQHGQLLGSPGVANQPRSYLKAYTAEARMFYLSARAFIKEF